MQIKTPQIKNTYELHNERTEFQTVRLADAENDKPIEYKYKHVLSKCFATDKNLEWTLNFLLFLI